MTRGKKLRQEIRKKIQIDLIFILIVTLFSLTYFYLDPSITGFVVYSVNGSVLNNTDAVFFNTTFNESGFIQLNDSAEFGFGSTGRNFSFRGNYTSKILDANKTTVQWINFSWGEGIPYGEELVGGFTPGSHFIEQNGAARGFNMTGLVLLFHLNNISGFENYSNNTNFTIWDSSENNNNGTAATNTSTGSPTFTPSGKFRGAFDFNGKDRYFEIRDNNSLDLPTTFTIMFWAYPTNIVTTMTVISKRDVSNSRENYDVTLLGTNSNWILTFDSDAQSTPLTRAAGTAIPNQWQNVVFTFDTNADVINGYLNGVLGGTYTETINPLVNAASVLIGVLQDSSLIQFFNGTIDEVAIWNRTLSSQEIQDLYKRGHGNLSVQVRSCDDASCSGESFVGLGNTSSSYFTNATFNLLNTSITGNNQYFQYQALFERDINNSNFTTELYNVTIGSNYFPNNANTTINPSLPITTDNLNCSLTYLDVENNPGTGTIIWYNNSAEHFRVNITASGNNTIISYLLTSNVTNTFAVSQNWTCAARTNDGQVNSESWINASVLIDNPIGSPKKIINDKRGSSSQSGYEEKTSVETISLLTSGNIYQYRQLAPGINKIEIQDKALALESIGLYTSVLINNPEIKIEELIKVEGIKELDFVHGYINIEHNNLLNSALSNIYLNFKLSKSQVNNKDVSLYLYDGGWIKLDTNKGKEEGNFVYYQSKAPHLSLFAIRVSPKEEAKETKVINLIPEAGEQLSEEQLTLKEKTVFSSILSIVLLLLVLFVMALIKSHRFRKIILYMLFLLGLVSLIYSFISYNLNNPDINKGFTKKEIIIYSLLTAFLFFSVLTYLFFEIRKLSKKTSKNKIKKKRVKKKKNKLKN